MRLAPIKSQVKRNCPIFLGNALVYKLQLSIKTKRMKKVDNNKNDTHNKFNNKPCQVDNNIESLYKCLFY